MNVLSTELKCAIVHECFEKNISYDDCQLILGKLNALVADYLTDLANESEDIVKTIIKDIDIKQ